MKKPTKSSMTRRLDKLCSNVVRRSPCAKCGEEQHDKLQCAHIFSRTYRNTRWSLNNLVCLCASCHFWAHRNPVLFGEFVITYLGDINYINLKLQARSIKKWTIPEMLELEQDLLNVS